MDNDGADELKEWLTECFSLGKDSVSSESWNQGCEIRQNSVKVSNNCLFRKERSERKIA